jgi:cbb3-type cytochrome c oxidase subunit III
MRNALLALTTMSMLGACQPAAKTEPDPAAEKARADSIRVAESVRDGAPVYLTYCAMCHGDGGAGDGEVSAQFAGHGTVVARLNDPERLGKMSREDLTRIIEQGGDHTGRSNLMPAWGDTLDAKQLADVVEFVMALPSNNPGISSATIHKYLEAPPGVPAEGRALFVHHCVACHGSEGKGDGPFAARIAGMANKAKVRNLTDTEYFSTLTDEQLFATVSMGGGHFKKATQMPAWNLSLTPGQIKNLVAYVRSLSNTTSPN